MGETNMERRPTRRTFLKGLGTGALAGGALGASGGALLATEVRGAAHESTGGCNAKERSEREGTALPVTLARVAADPSRLPPPITRRTPAHVELALETVEGVAEIESGVTFRYMTFGGQIPGTMLRVRRGDTVRLTLRNRPGNMMAHNIDLHAVYGPGGGAEATMVMPGQQKTIEFQARYPGAFIYHCAAPNLDFHISSGMYGMILVEPEEGLPPVAREFYLGQHEVYTNRPAGEAGHHEFDFAALTREQPTYVLLNGEREALTASRRGAIRARVGERARLFFVNGGPNLASSFHPIGNIWTSAWPAGALANAPQHYVQTQMVPPGSCGVFELEFPVPEDVKLVDHALSRVVHKGMLGIIDVEGPARPGVFAAVGDSRS